MQVRIYMARKMTGRIKADVVNEATQDRLFLERAGMRVLCPVASEGVKKTKEKLESTKKQMDEYWFRDKAMIRSCDVLFDMSPHAHSQGVEHELGYARYTLWKPVVRVFPAGQLPPEGSVAYYEDDFICDSLLEAVEYVYRAHGTRFLRLRWRLRLLLRCSAKFLGQQAKSLIQTFYDGLREVR